MTDLTQVILTDAIVSICRGFIVDRYRVRAIWSLHATCDTSWHYKFYYSRYTFKITSSSAHEYLETVGMAPYTNLSSLGVNGILTLAVH